MAPKYTSYVRLETRTPEGEDVQDLVDILAREETDREFFADEISFRFKAIVWSSRGWW